MANDGRIFARTRNELMPMNDFIEKYRQFRYDDRKMNETVGVDSVSYSQMIIDNVHE